MADVLKVPKAPDPAAYRASLEDVVAVMSKLNQYCNSIDEAIAVVTLACENDGQLQILMSLK